MNYPRAIGIATAIWTLGVLVFLFAGYLIKSDNPELQANLSLALALLPLGWFGARYYYKKGSQTPGYRLAAIMVFTAVVLDAMITVPVFFLPIGVTYGVFFGGGEFWVLIAEYAGIVMWYDITRRRQIVSSDA